jgi:hypothetical protein
MNDDQGQIGSDQFGADDERLVDLLVDGELEASERRDLLHRLDSTPDGWRRCALAFLESQAWRQAIGSEVLGVATAPASAGVAAVVASASKEKGRRGWTRAARSVLALAATILLAFGLGWLVREPGQILDGIARLTRAASHDVVSAGNPSSDAAKSPPSEQLLPPTPIRFVGLLTWKVSEDGTEREVTVPIVEGDAIDEEWLLRQPPAIPESMVRELERRGHKVAANRQLLSIDLEDGRRAVLPVDQLEVRVAGRVYQ